MRSGSGSGGRSSGTQPRDSGDRESQDEDFVSVPMRVETYETNARAYPAPVPVDADDTADLAPNSHRVPRFSTDPKDGNVAVPAIDTGRTYSAIDTQNLPSETHEPANAFGFFTPRPDSTMKDGRNRLASCNSTASLQSQSSQKSEDEYGDVGGFGLGRRFAKLRSTQSSFGFGSASPGKKQRRKTSMRGGKTNANKHRGLSGARKTLLTNAGKELPSGTFTFFTETFKLKGTILFKTVPQIVCAALVGLFANVVKLVYCGENVTTNEECDVTFNLDGHLGVSVVLSFLLVFRADLAWKRYEQGKAALGAVHGGIRNLNVAAAVFLRPKNGTAGVYCAVDAGGYDSAGTGTPSTAGGGKGSTTGSGTRTLKPSTGGNAGASAPAEGGYFSPSRPPSKDQGTPNDSSAASKYASGLERDRGEIFRLTNLLYAFVRHAVRGQRHGYSDCGPVTDDELLLRDRGGKPRVPDLFKDGDEKGEFKSLAPWNRPNACASKIAEIVERRRRSGSLGERASLDAFRDLKVVLDALKSMERIVTTPVPYQYLHMLNVLLFFFVYSVPFVFTANFKWVTPFPSAVCALAFYGVNEIGRCMEDPFSWEAPCHDLSGVGWRACRENAQIHADADRWAKCDSFENNGDDDDDGGGVSSDGTRIRHNSVRSTLSDVSGTDVEGSDDDDETATTVDDYMLPKELSTHWSGFFTEIFVFRDTVMPTLLPQIVVAFFLGVLAQVVKMRACGADVVAAAECQTTFDITGHQVVSVSLGFLLVFRTDWAYDRYYEGKASLGLLYSGMRNLNVLFVNFLRENRVGESEEFTKNTESSNVDGTFDPNAKERNAGKVTARTSFSSAAGTYDEFDSQKTYDERLHINKQVRKDRAELLRLTNVMYALMRQALRELRVARNLDVSKKFNFFGKADPKTSVPSSDADCLLVDDSGSPKLPNFLRPGEAQRLAQLSQSNRHNWIAMRIQNLVETNRRLGNIGERASFEIYQEIEACLAAYKAMERIVSTPIPFTYTHMLQLILFFFVFSAPFVFTTTFHWIAFVPSVIVAIGFYGVNEMGKVIQDPFDWRQPCHDLSGMGRRAFEENLALHEHAEKRDFDLRRDELRKTRRAVARRSREKRGRDSRGGRDSETSDYEKADASVPGDDDTDHDPVSLRTLRAALEGKGGISEASKKEAKDDGLTEKSLNISVHAPSARSATLASDASNARAVPDLSAGPWAFLTTLFKVKHTVLPRVFPQVVFAIISSLCAQTLKIYWCGANIVSHSQCSIAFSETAHAVAGGVIGFMLVFRTSISYYRFYEGKKYLGHLHDSLRNANVAFCVFLRSGGTRRNADGTKRKESRDSRDGAKSKTCVETETAAAATATDETLNEDRIELRRLSNVLFAFVRQSLRERRHGYPLGCTLQATDDSLINDDVYGAPTLNALLTADEKNEFTQVDPPNRANVVVWRMQTIVERHRRLGNVCERGAFDIYHDLEATLEAHKHMERIVNTKMPFQYLHAVNFLLFVFVFSAPFVFTTGFKWLSPVPSTIVAVAFYGVAEVARSIEDPYTWEQPSHDLSHVGWRLYVESLELHEQSVVDAGDTRMGKQSQLTCDGGAGIFLGSGGVKTVLRNGPDSVPSVSLGDVTVVDLTVVADIGDGGVTSVVTKTIDAKIDASTRPVSAAHGAADRALVFAGRPDPEQETAKAFARIAAAGKSVDDTSADDLKPGKTVGNGNEHAEGSQEESPCLKLSSSKFGFFTDVFRVKGTVHGEVNVRTDYGRLFRPMAVLPQVILAFIVGWCAQLLKLWRCGGMVQEAYECSVTFEPHAHAVVGSVLAFMIVYRFKFAYDRYYEAKTAISELHCGLRNFNIGACAFLRLDDNSFRGAGGDNGSKDTGGNNDSRGMFFWKKNDATSTVKKDGDKKDKNTTATENTTEKTTAASSLLRERTELLRLSGCLFAFLRQRLREHRLGYPTDKDPGDYQVLTSDICGAPKLGTLLLDQNELKKYSSVPFRNRPNVAAIEMQLLVERLRRRGLTCERGAFDLYRECERVLNALTCCERIVETPVPFQYVQMSHFVTFFFVYSAPFIFTTSYQYISFFPSCLLAMAFYGINCIGEVIERPFDWREPNHDLAGIGLRVWRECAQLHARCAAHDQRHVAAGDAAHDAAVGELQALCVRAASNNTEVPPAVVEKRRGTGAVEGVATSEEEKEFNAFVEASPEAPAEASPESPRTKSLFALAMQRRQSAFAHARLLRLREYPRFTFSFLTGLFSGSSNALRRALPQVITASATGVVANAAKHVWCGDSVTRSSECALTFHTEAHAICGAIIGFLLVFCANIAYVKFYEAKTASGAMYHGLRNILILSCAFLRSSYPDEPGYVTDTKTRQERWNRIDADVDEIARLVDILFAFLRIALREQRHGYRVMKGLGGSEAAPGSVPFLKTGWRKTAGGGTGKVSDVSIITEDLSGSPSLSQLLTSEEQQRYLSIDSGNRFNVVVCDIHRAIEHRRELGDVYEKAAHEMYRECDTILAAYKTCERIVTTPIPYQYTHMVNLVLFCFVFSAPFVFSATFDWLTPAPSAVLALGFYGIWEVGKTMMDPFDWNSPMVDLTAIGRRVSDEGKRNAKAARDARDEVQGERE